MNSRLEKVIAQRASLEKIANKYADVLRDGFISACSEADLPSEEKIRQDYAEKVENDKDLQIGIVGRVKAGKSSLLNALLFDGRNILPKAATPMTAALTVLSYSEKVEVKVNFFDDEDLRALKEKSDAYERELQKLTDAEFEKAKQKSEERSRMGKLSVPFDEKKAKEVAAKNALRKIKEDVGLSGAFDQYKLIKESKVNRSDVSGQKVLRPESLESISSMLGEYVGSDGKYMPFTQSVGIAYPNEKLKGCRIVDTPGFNDPVPSRNQLAYALLKASDVVLILSPAGQFLNDVDKDVVSKITQKEGLRELFVLASQVDNELFGGEYADMEDVFKVREEVKSALTIQQQSVLSSINNNGIFDQLISNDSSRIIMTSGDCHSMYLTFANRKTMWDDNKQTIWNNLCERFKDFFNEKDENVSRESLKKLGNAEVVQEKIDSIKSRKDEILAGRSEQICTSRENAVATVKEIMQKSIKQQMERIRNGNLASLMNEKGAVESFCLKVEPGITRVVYETVADWRSETTKSLIDFVGMLFNESKSEANAAKTSFTRSHSYTTGHLWWKSYHSYETHHTRVSIPQVRASIEEFISKVNSSLSLEVEDELERLKRKLASKISILWAEKAADQSLDSDAVANKIRAIIEGLNLPDFKLPRGLLPQKLCQSSSCEDSDGDEILCEARSHLTSLSNTLRTTLTDEVARYANSMQKSDMTSTLLERYRSQLDTLIKDIQNREESMAMYESIQKEIEALV